MFFSRDGRMLATVSGDGTVRLLDMATRRQIGAPLLNNDVLAMAFSPDGRMLATGGGDGTVRLWDVITRRQIGASLSAGSDSVSSVAFSPDGQILATESRDETARLWDVATHQQIGPPLPDSGLLGLLPFPVMFSSDGTVLATTIMDVTGEVRILLWDVGFPRDLPSAVCAIAGRSITRQEWNTYVQSLPFQQVCP
jgi:WD40 repeat protein